jgi:hypothetical protein
MIGKKQNDDLGLLCDTLMIGSHVGPFYYIYQVVEISFTFYIIYITKLSQINIGHFLRCNCLKTLLLFKTDHQQIVLPYSSPYHKRRFYKIHRYLS